MTSTMPTVDEVRTVVQVAGLAPSVHNTQPWRFTWDGAGLDLREEMSRALPVLDPSGRERVLSCGAAALQAELAFAEFGWATDVTLLPEGERAEVLARLRITGRKEATAEEHALVAAAARRTTDRDPYQPRQIPVDVLARLRAAAECQGAWLRVVDPVRDEVTVDVLSAHADDLQRRDPAYLAELACWRTETGVQGVRTRALPEVPHEERGSNLSLRDFDAASGPGDARRRSSEPPRAENPSVVVLGTGGDGRRDWLIAGRATARVLLQATVENVAAQPLTAVLEVSATRARLRSSLCLVGHPQMVLRLGYGTHGPVSGRLPVDQILDVLPGSRSPSQRR